MSRVLQASRPFLAVLSRRGIGLRRGSLELCQYFAQRRNQLIARNMALLELNPELERLRGRFELKDERLWPLRSRMLLAAFTAPLLRSQSALHDPMVTPDLLL